MRVRANELRVGDAIALNDWMLHVAAVLSGPRVAVRTTEFDFVLHFASCDRLEVTRTGQPRGAAA